MHLADAFRAYGASAQSALVDPFLDRDVRFGFELEVSLFPSYPSYPSYPSAGDPTQPRHLC